MKKLLPSVCLYIGTVILLSAHDAGAPLAAQAAPGDAPVARAVRAVVPPTLDGHLSDAVWADAQVLTGFTQVEPRAGMPSSLPTEVRLLYDDRYLYVAAFMHDPEGEAGVRVPDVRRSWDDSQSDFFGISLDGFGDRRTAMAFLVNPRGAVREVRVVDGSYFDREWRGLWEARTTVTDSGWIAEMRIPWSTLRYLPDVATWHVNFVRRARRSDELSGWAAWPRDRNAYTMQYAGALHGLEPPPPGRNVRVQPYAVTRAGRLGGAAFGDDTRADAGGDVKWAVTPNTVFDLTVNTDFAEADADRQVLNLSRVSVFFPEQRSFFLENAGLFRIGGERVVEPFFSRRIGLDRRGEPVPLDGGVRLTSQAPTRSFGVLATRQRATDTAPGAFLGVARVRQNFGRQNYIGVLTTSRVDDAFGELASRQNHVFAADGYVRPTARSLVRTMAAVSTTSDAPSGWSSYTHLATQGPWGYAGWLQSFVSSDFDASAGYVSRHDLMVSSPAANLDIRAGWLPPYVRAYRPGFTTFFYHRLSDLAFQEGSVTLRPLNFQFQDGAELTVWQHIGMQRLDVPFAPIPGLQIQPGSHDYLEGGVTWKPDLSRPYWAYVTVQGGGFYDGRRYRVIYRASPLPGPRLGVTFDYVGDRFVDVGTVESTVVSHLAGVELRAALNPRLQLVSTWQHNSVFRVQSWNTRLAWEYRPLSYLYVVFNDGQSIAGAGAGGTSLPRQQQLIVKLSWIGQL